MAVIWERNTARFRVTLGWEYEDCPDLSWMEAADLEKIESGEWVNCCFSVKVYLDGREIAADYLGNSVYADPRDFAREHIGIRAKSRADGTNYGCYFPDMLREAIGEARKNLHGLPRLRA